MLKAKERKITLDYECNQTTTNTKTGKSKVISTKVMLRNLLEIADRADNPSQTNSTFKHKLPPIS